MISISFGQLLADTISTLLDIEILDIFCRVLRSLFVKTLCFMFNPNRASLTEYKTELGPLVAIPTLQ